MEHMISVEDHGNVAVVRLAHGKVSALDIELCRAITLIMRAHTDAAAIVLTGTGSVFSAGVDLRRIRDGGRSYIAEFLPALDEAFLAVFDAPRPVVAAINGHALAGGCLLAAACDLRLMSAGRIGVTEMPVGLPFPLAGLEIMRYAFGPATNRLVFTAEKMGAAAAHARGLVDELVGSNELMNRALQRAQALAAIPTATYALTKEQLHRPTKQLIDEGRTLGDEARIAAVWQSPTAHAAVGNYLETLAQARTS
jgi:enoyl-CoA hydratase